MGEARRWSGEGGLQGRCARDREAEQAQQRPSYHKPRVKDRRYMRRLEVPQLAGSQSVGTAGARSGKRGRLDGWWSSAGDQAQSRRPGWNLVAEPMGAQSERARRSLDNVCRSYMKARGGDHGRDDGRNRDWATSAAPVVEPRLGTSKRRPRLEVPHVAKSPEARWSRGRLLVRMGPGGVVEKSRKMGSNSSEK